MDSQTCIKGTCKKCGASLRVEVNGQSMDMVKERLAVIRGYECPGQHVELGILLDGYEWDWTPFSAPETPSDEEYGRSLMEQYGMDRVYYLGDEAVGRALGIKNLITVPGLAHLGFGDFGDAEHYYVRHDSPCFTTRFYIQQRR